MLLCNYHVVNIVIFNPFELLSTTVYCQAVSFRTDKARYVAELNENDICRSIGGSNLRSTNFAVPFHALNLTSTLI